MSGKGFSPWAVLGSLAVGAVVVGGVSWAIKNSSSDYESDLDKIEREQREVTKIYDDTLRKAQEGHRKPPEK